MQPLVSIIIPVYNVADYLDQAILSALEQTWPNKEIVIVNDGSTDNSLAVAQKYAGGVVSIYSQNNKGASAARNLGLQKSKGDFIQFLDGDDILAANKIQAQLTQSGCDPGVASICPVIHFRDADSISKLSSSPYENSFLSNSKAPFDFMLNLYGANNNRGSMIPVHSWLIPAKIIEAAGPWDENLTVNDDGDFFCRVALKANEILFADNTNCYYRKHPKRPSLSNRNDEKSLVSQYRSILKRRDVLRACKDDNRINIVTARSLIALLMLTYPSYKDLSEKISEEIESLNVVVPLPKLGGPITEVIKKVFGWKLTRVLQTYYANAFKI